MVRLEKWLLKESSSSSKQESVFGTKRILRTPALEINKQGTYKQSFTQRVGKI